MAAYADRFKRTEEQLPLAFACLEPLRDICPAVRELLIGVIDDQGIEVVKRASILIFMDGNRLKYLITPKDGNEKGWGTFEDVRNPFTQIELDLNKDRVDWKPTRSSQDELTRDGVGF